MGSSDGLVRDFIFGFNDSRFSDRELIVVLAEDVTPTDSGEFHSTENGVEGDDSSCSKDCSKVLNLHVNSLLLAEKSPFFHKLFTNGMMESKQRCVSLRIHASEETAILELLKYMYSGSLTASSQSSLLDVLKLADRFEVISCMRLCVKLLTELPMTTEFALLYLDFTSSTSRTDEVQHLADATKLYLEDRYKDIDKLQDEIMELPLAGLETILSSDVLQVFSEDTIFDLVVKWIETHYTEVEDQKKILSAQLGKYIRFPYMSVDKLRDVLGCNILDDGFAYKAVVDALFFKVEAAPHHHQSTKCPAIKETENSASSNHYRPYARRDYKRRPIKVLPCQEIVVRFELKFDECLGLKAEERICSEAFDFGGVPFYLFAEQVYSSYSGTKFYVRLKQDKVPRVTLYLHYEFSAMSKSSKSLDRKSSGDPSFNSEGLVTLYETPWSSFEAGNSLDSIDGCLKLGVKLRMR